MDRCVEAVQAKGNDKPTAIAICYTAIAGKADATIPDDVMEAALASIREANAVKAIDGSLTLDILGLPFGADRQGQTFNAQTNIDLREGDRIPLYYHHGFAEASKATVERIGEAVYRGADAAGHWFKGVLDSGLDIARRVYEDARKGLARASSDSAAHLVRPFGIVGKPGVVTNWPIFAVSLMDAATAQTAVNPRAMVMAAAKAFIAEQEAELQNQSGEASAAKAGATFARRNRDRILSMKAMLDEMMSEFPADAGVADEAPATAAVVAGRQIENERQEIAIKSDDVLGLPDDELRRIVADKVRNIAQARGFLK